LELEQNDTWSLAEHAEPLRPFPFRRVELIDPGHEA
jgi:hypothetical protein